MSDTFTIGTAGTYYVDFGVTNIGDQLNDSGLAISGLNVNGNPIGAPVPEPGTFALFGIGLAGLAVARRLRLA
jgi:hypothetical protein